MANYSVLITKLYRLIGRRVSKCFERIKVVNLGGSAIGAGITVPRYFIMEVVNELQRLTKLPITKSENLPDATSNLDTFVEVHTILKSHAVNLEKMVNDIRLLASELAKEMKYSDINIFEANKKLGVIEEVKLDKILEIQNLLKTGFSINDLL